jgi:hypothetical protein
MFAAVGALVFLAVAPAGLWAVRYFGENQLPADSPFRQTLRHLGPLLTDLSLAVQVGAGLVGIFMALVIATRRAMPKE